MTDRSRDIVLLALLALFTNFTYFFASNGDYTFPDSDTYLVPAFSLLHGHGFTGDLGFPETIRTPVYSLFLLPFLAFAKSLAPIVIAQHLINVALTIAIYVFSRRRFSRFIANAAAILFAIDTPVIHYANKVLTETLFTAGLFVLFVFVLQQRKVITSAILTGALVLLRPLAVLFFALATFFFPKKRVAIYAVISLVLPIAWGIRNKVETGVFTISSIAGVNMLLHRAAGALAMIDAGEFKDDLSDRQQELLQDANDVLKERYHVDDPMAIDPAIRGAYYDKAGSRIVLQHPIGLAMLMLRGVLVNLFDSDWEAVMVVSNIDASLIQFAIEAYAHAIILLAIIGVITLWRNLARRLSMMITLTVLYFLVISAGGESEARFRVPVMPMIAIAAAVGVDAIKRAAVPVRQ